MLLNVLTLSPILPNAAPGVVRIIELLHTAEDKDDVALGAALRALAALEDVAGETRFGLVDMVERWGWSESVMSALVGIQSCVYFVRTRVAPTNLDRLSLFPQIAFI
jgi:hypothetical protein